MKLFIKVGFSVENPFEHDESHSINTCVLAVITGSEDPDDAENAADLVQNELCPREFELEAVVEEYKIISDEEFTLLEKFLPVYNINITK